MTIRMIALAALAICLAGVCSGQQESLSFGIPGGFSFNLGGNGYGDPYSGYNGNGYSNGYYGNNGYGQNGYGGNQGGYGRPGGYYGNQGYRQPGGYNQGGYYG